MSLRSHAPVELDAWSVSLVAEAQRDLVFLWNITKGSFGGLGRAPDEVTLRAVVERLVKCGCSIGFGNPDSEDWKVPLELRVPHEKLASSILDLWHENPEQNGFLVFALRTPRAQA